MKFFVLTALLLCLCIFSSSAQSKKEKKSKKQAEKSQADNSFAPFTAAESATVGKQTKSTKKSRKKSESFSQTYRKGLDQKKVEFQKRMKQNAKDNRKEARLALKPQYSDPTYFGHKKKPKKRKLNKRKMCKECGIVH